MLFDSAQARPVGSDLQVAARHVVGGHETGDVIEGLPNICGAEDRVAAEQRPEEVHPFDLVAADVALALQPLQQAVNRRVF